MLTQSQLGESLSEWSWPGQRGSKRNTTSPGFWTESKLHCAASVSGSKHKKGLKNTYLLGHKLMKGLKNTYLLGHKLMKGLKNTYLLGHKLMKGYKEHIY